MFYFLRKGESSQEVRIPPHKRKGNIWALNPKMLASGEQTARQLLMHLLNVLPLKWKIGQMLNLGHLCSHLYLISTPCTLLLVQLHLHNPLSMSLT